MAFYELEPWGCMIDDQRAQVLAGLTFAVNSDGKTPIPNFFDRTYKPDDKEDDEVIEAQRRNVVHQIQGYFLTYAQHEKVEYDDGAA